MVHIAFSHNLTINLGGITSGTFHLRNDEYALYQRRYDCDKTFAELNSFCILYAGSFTNMKKVEKIIQDAIGSEGLLANSLYDTPGITPNQNENDGLTIVYMVPLINEQDYLQVGLIFCTNLEVITNFDFISLIIFQRFLTKSIPVAAPNSTSLAINSIMALEDKKSYLCHLCGRCVCKKPSEHVLIHSTLTSYSFNDSHHKFDNNDYNITALNSIAKYKQITHTDDIAKTFLRTDQLLYDLFLFHSNFSFVGYNIMGINYQYSSRSLVNGNKKLVKYTLYNFTTFNSSQLIF